MRAINIVSVN